MREHAGDSPSLDDLVAHHGHLGGFDVLGYKGGQLILQRLNARRHFGLHLVVWCPPQPPHSCLLDGLQMATGCTMGKRNIALRPAVGIRVRAINLDTGCRLVLRPRPEAVEKILDVTATQGASAAGQWAWEQAPEDLWELTGAS